MENGSQRQTYGSPAGLLLTVLVGFGFYFLLMSVPIWKEVTSYENMIAAIDTPQSQIKWFLINFTEAEFYAGAVTSVFLLAGAAAAWQLSLRKPKYAGFEICYGNARIWPWVFASQVLSLLLTEYLFGYLKLFHLGESWIPTFIVLVSVPPSMVLLYGPGIKKLLTASAIGSVLCTPAAYWISKATAGLGIPAAVNNVLAMAITGIIAGCVCRVLPWMKKPGKTEPGRTELEKMELGKTEPEKMELGKTEPEKMEPGKEPVDYKSAFWVLRRTLADLTEPQFYGNDVASVFLLAGVCIEWFLNPSLLSGGAGMLPAIILSQFISGGIGVFLYTGKYQEKGWYATYVPVVCTAPACILMYGASMPIILVSSILGGVIGAPLAEWLDERRPDYIHGTVSNVLAMAISTVMVSAVINCISWL